MFTGIIQTTARVERVLARGGGARLTLAPTRRLSRLVLGESIAVDGACLTVTSGNGKHFTVDVSPETLRRTTAAALARGGRVNLERSLRLGDRLGGHIVLGHVDGVGRLDAVTPEGDWVLYRFRAPRPIWPYLVEKGSIAVDGVSLTLFRCQDGRFTVAMIPHTLAETTLAERVPGDRVNLEADVMLKHIEALLRRARPGHLTGKSSIRRRAARTRRAR
jgi:riboflavin synthase